LEYYSKFTRKFWNTVLNSYIAFEIKQAEHVRSVDARHLRTLDEILDKPVLHKFLISNDEDVKYFDGNVTAISALQFLT